MFLECIEFIIHKIVYVLVLYYNDK